jgi:hypothetical protein
MRRCTGVGNANLKRHRHDVAPSFHANVFINVFRVADGVCAVGGATDLVKLQVANGFKVRIRGGKRMFAYYCATTAIENLGLTNKL